MGHDPLCELYEQPKGYPAYCQCDLITKVRMDERQAMADNLWPYIQPIVDWIAGVNTPKGAK